MDQGALFSPISGPHDLLRFSVSVRAMEWSFSSNAAFQNSQREFGSKHLNVRSLHVDQAVRESFLHQNLSVTELATKNRSAPFDGTSIFEQNVQQ